MAGLFALVQELLPMLMPGSVQITRAADIRPASPVSSLVDDGLPDKFRGIRLVDAEEERRDPRGDERPRGRSQYRVGSEHASDVETRTARRADSKDELEEEAEKEQEKEQRQRRQRQTSRPPILRDPRNRHTGVSMHAAIVNKTDRMCAAVLTVKPQCSTVVFHNAEQESIVYAVTGTAVLATLSDDHDAHSDSDSAVPPPPPKRHELGPGDFAFVPAWTEHQVINESEDTEVVWVVVRSGPEPTVVPLTGWGGPEAD